MLCALHTPLSFNLSSLAEDSVVTVGRESGNAIRLDSPAVPYLLSRHHATLAFQADGSVVLTDLASTNGTYVSRGSSFRRLQTRRSGSDESERRTPASWTLMANDVIGFGGPETIVADGGEHVPNPFMFRYRPRIIYEPPPMSPDHVMAERNDALSNDLEDDVDAQDGTGQGRDVIEIDINDLSPAGGVASTSGREALGATAVGPNASRRVTQDGCVTAGTGSGGVDTAQVTDIVAKHLTCPICQEWLLASHMLPCGHMFCGLCLAKWLALAERQSCPACRKPVGGLPVRCFQVDNTISDLLGAGPEIMSPNCKQDRRRKQRHWEDIQVSVVQDWTVCLQPKRQHVGERRPHRPAAPVPHMLVGNMVEPRHSVPIHVQHARRASGNLPS